MFAPAPADVAQLVEQRFRKPQVTGSNPVVGSTFACGNAETNTVGGASVGRIVLPQVNFLAASYSLAGTRLRFVGIRR